MKRTPQRLLQGLQLLAGLKAHGLAGRNRDFGAGARVSANPGLTRLYVEYTEAAQLDSVALFEGLFHGFEDRLNGHFRFGLGNAGFIDNFVNDIQLDQSISSGRSLSTTL